MLRKFLSMLLAIAVLGSGCGTIVHGTRQDVNILSNPAGATATISGSGLKVKTPATVSLARDKDYVVIVERDGYESGQATINREFSGWATIGGNILWLLVGAVVDLWTGGAWNLKPEAVNVNLEKKK